MLFVKGAAAGSDPVACIISERTSRQIYACKCYT
jgi:hypothetical protein